MELKVKLTDGAPLPKHARPGDAGMDLTTRNAVTVYPGETIMVHTGVWVEIPEGYYGAVVPRSGMASKRKLAPVNSPGTIDSGYRGEVLVPLHNFASPSTLVQCRTISEGLHWELWPNHDAIQRVEAGERVAQLIVVPYAACECVQVGELSDTERGDGGFGSTGAV